MTPDPNDLRRRLLYWAENKPNAPAFTYLERGEKITAEVTFAGLLARAQTISAQLQDRQLAGQTAVLLYPPGLSFVEAFFGCILANVIAVPVPHPVNVRARQRIAAIATAALPAVVLSLGRYCRDAGLREDIGPADVYPLWMPTDELEVLPVGATGLSQTTSDDLALLQFTSGSTARPKGVEVSFSNLAANHQMIAKSYGDNPDEAIVTWLPLFHDMGLIGTVLYALYSGRSVQIMPPFAFLQKPLRWLSVISSSGATCSGAPNFAFDLISRSVTVEDAEKLDLRRWRTAFCGAEPVRPKTMLAFSKVLAPAGFDPTAILPCYGMAETTLFVAAGDSGRGVQVAQSRNDLASCGSSASPQTLAIVGPDGCCLPDGVEGEIWIAGPHVAKGYWQDPQMTATSFGFSLAEYPGETFLRTGDLGFLEDKQIFVSGRIKDVLIVRGVKHHAVDLAATVSAVDARFLTGGGTVVTLDEAEQQKIVVLQEMLKAAFPPQDADVLKRDIGAALIESHGFKPDEVFLLREGQLLRTTSGKLQRPGCATLAADLILQARQPNEG